MRAYNNSFLSAPKVTYRARRNSRVYTKVQNLQDIDPKTAVGEFDLKTIIQSNIEAIDRLPADIDQVTDRDVIREKIKRQILSREKSEALRIGGSSLITLTKRKKSGLSDISKQKNISHSLSREPEKLQILDETPLNWKSIEQREQAKLEAQAEMENKINLKRMKDKSRPVNMKFRKTVTHALLNTQLMQYTNEVHKVNARGSRMRQGLVMGLSPSSRGKESVSPSVDDFRTVNEPTSIRNPKRRKHSRVKATEEEANQIHSPLRQSEKLSGSIPQIDQIDEVDDIVESIENQLSSELPYNLMEDTRLRPISQREINKLNVSSLAVLSPSKMTPGFTGKSSFFTIKNGQRESHSSKEIPKLNLERSATHFSIMALAKPENKEKTRASSHERKFIKRPLTKCSKVKVARGGILSSRVATTSRNLQVQQPMVTKFGLKNSGNSSRGRRSVFKVEASLPKFDMTEISQAILRAIEKREVVDNHFTKKSKEGQLELVSTSLAEEGNTRFIEPTLSNLAHEHERSKESSVEMMRLQYNDPIKSRDTSARKQKLSLFTIRARKVGVQEIAKQNRKIDQYIKMRPEQKYSADVSKYGYLLNNMNMSRIILSSVRKE